SLSAADRYEVFVGWTSWADISPLGATKASALEWLRSRLGVPRDGTVAVGDGTNDIAMIEWAFFGAAMGGAIEEVRAHADHVTAAVENDGAAAVMRVVLERCGVDGER
ncbi:MAG: HAD family phosphatase, partial [Schaalia georgiae]|nr:HAD family phosphatase [Schaalia georgiae]